MNTVIIYDSQYGNTEKIAQAIHEALSTQAQVTLLKASGARAEQLAGADLLIAGAPTQRFKTTETMTALLNRIPGGALKGVKVAAFDTRLTLEEIRKTAILAFFVKRAGKNAWAATVIANQLKAKGGEPVGTPEGFFVLGTEGPLVDGELERAKEWARQVVASADTKTA